MNDTYYLKIEVSLPTQVELIDSILEVKHDEEETGAWVLSMDYEPVFGDLPIFYISNFIGFLIRMRNILQKERYILCR